MNYIEKARSYAMSHESPKRFAHTEGVASDCARLCEIFELDAETSEKLCLAAWLHDSTKERTPAEQAELCREFGISEPPDGYGSPTLHAVTAAHLARKLFPEFADDTVFLAIRYHTTGRADMTIPEMILCFADYSEASRKYIKCRELRKLFYENVNSVNRDELLMDCLRQAFESTITSLSNSGDFIDPDTFEGQRYLTGRIKELRGKK